MAKIKWAVVIAMLCGCETKLESHCANYEAIRSCMLECIHNTSSIRDEEVTVLQCEDSCSRSACSERKWFFWRGGWTDCAVATGTDKTACDRAAGGKQ